MLDAIAAWFSSLGVHPVVGGALIGATLVFARHLVMWRREPPDDPVRGPARPAASMGSGSSPQQFPASITVKRDGEEITLPPEVVARLRQLIRAGQHIEAIKVVRAVAELDLKDAKRVVDSLKS